MRKKWPYIKIICMALDAYLILASYYAAFLLRHDVLGGMVTIDVRSDGYIYLSLVYAAMMVLCFYLPVRVAAGGEGHGQYLEDRVGRRTGHCVLTAVFFLTKIVHISRLALAMVWLLRSS